MVSRGAPTASSVADLATHVQHLTVKEIGVLKQRLGMKINGPKADVARKIAERATNFQNAPPAPPQAAQPHNFEGAYAQAVKTMHSPDGLVSLDDLRGQMRSTGSNINFVDFHDGVQQLVQQGKAEVVKLPGSGDYRVRFSSSPMFGKPPPSMGARFHSGGGSPSAQASSGISSNSIVYNSLMFFLGG